MTASESHFLDSVRSWCLFVVLIAHAIQVFISPYWDYSVALQDWPIAQYAIRRGPAYAVMAFFSMSGLLIYYSVVSNTQKHGGFRLGYYIVARLLRVYPPLIFSLILVLVFHVLLNVSGIAGKETFASGDELYLPRSEINLVWKDIIGAGVFINTLIPGFNSPILNGPLWSIAHEFWFYMLAIPILMLLFRHWLVAVLGCVAYIYLCFTLYLELYIDEWWFYGWCVWLVAFFMTHLERIAPKKVFYLITFCCAFPASWLWYFLVVNSYDSYYDYRSYFPGGILFSIVLPFILVKIKGEKIKTTYSLAMSKIAGFSYTAYLIHFPIFLMFFFYTNLWVESWLGRLLILLSALIISIVSASYLARYLESRVLRKAWLEKLV